MRMKILLSVVTVLALAVMASATVPSATSEVSLLCDGVQVEYTFPYKILASSDLVVTTDVPSSLALGTDYTVTGVGLANGGHIDLTAGSKCPNTKTLKIKRVVPLTQPTSFRTQGAFSPAAHENAFDRVTMAAQQLDRDHLELANVVGTGNPDANLAQVTPTGATTARLLRDIFADAINVRSYGAKGDGVTDDTAAIQAAITAGAATRRSIVLPAGTYRTTAPLTLPSNSTLIGYGAKILFDNDNANDSVIVVSGVSHVSISGLEVDGQKASVPTVTEFKVGIDIKTSTDITLRDLYLHDNKGDGIYVGAAEGMAPCERVTIDNVWCDANYRQGLTLVSIRGCRVTSSRFTGSVGTAPQSGLDIEPNFDADVLEDIRFVACEFSGNAGEGVTGWSRLAPTSPQGDVHFVGCVMRGNGTNGVYLRYVRDWSFTDCDVVGNGAVGIGLDNNPRRVSIRGGSVRDNGHRGISAVITGGFDATDIVVSGVSVYDNGTSVPNTIDGIRFDGTVTNCSVDGCLIGNIDGATQRYGLSTGAGVSSLRVTGNRFVANATGAALLSDDGATRVALGNVGIPNALVGSRRVLTYSASITPVASDGNSQVITATDGSAFTINAPTGAVAGQRISLTVRNSSGGALGTITWNAIYKAAAWVSPANLYSRTVDFVFNGTNWVEVSRTPADVPS